MIRIGHRGAAGHAPENTLSAIEAAIDLGADFVELDVQKTHDGHLVIMHDKRVDRTTNGSGYVSSMMLSDLRILDAGDGQKIPTIEEVLEIADGRIGLMLEIITPGIAKQLHSIVSGSHFRSPAIYASFLHSEVRAIKEMDNRAASLALLEGVPIQATAFASDAGASHVGLGIDSITAPFIETLHAAGMQVFVYTVNDPRDVQWVRSLGIDGIISDYPERI